MAKLSKFVKNNLFTEVGGFILDARQAKVLYDLINQITGGGSYLMVGEIAVTNISDLNAPEFLLKEPGNYGLNIADGFEGHQNMNLNIAFNSTSTSGSIGLQDILQTIRVGEKVYTRTLVHTQMGENISLSYGEWADSTLPSNRFVSLQEKSFVQPYTIGQLAEGGIIFYILQDGDVGYDPTKQKGLVVSPNQNELAWNNEEYVLTGANKTILGYGKSNTDKIVAAQVGTVYNYPARKCTQLNLGGHVDWYLPDMDELLKLYSNSLEAGIDDLPFGMWSSTEYDLSYAILIYNDQEYNTVEKNQQYPFRAIRSYEINLSEKVEVDDEIMVSTGVEKEIRGSGKKLKDILNITENPEKIVKSLTTVDLNSLNRVDLTSGQYSLTGGLVGSLIVTNEIEDDILIGVLQELNDGDVIKVREITTIPNITYGDWVTKSITEEQKANSHEPHSDDQDLSGLVEKVEGEGLLPTTEREKLAQLDPLPSIPIGQVRKDDGKFHNITHQQVTELNTDPGFQHIDSTTETATIIDADALVIWNSITGKSEVTTYSHFKANLANNFVVKDIGNAGSATKLQTARSINGVAFDGTQGITINAVDITPRIATSLMGIANGVATLGNDTKVPLSQIPVSLLGQVNYKGIWDASTGSPSLPATPTANGDYYIVSVAGNTPMGTVSEWKVGDWLIANGTTWGKVDNTDAVSSVNGHTGIVVLSKSDVGLSNVVNALQWHDGNHPSTVSGYGITDIPTYSGTNFILNQNASAQSANMWISGNGKFQSSANLYCIITGTQISLSRPSDGAYSVYFQRDTSLGINQGTANIWGYDGIKFKTAGSETTALTIESSGAATFASTVNGLTLMASENNSAKIKVDKYLSLQDNSYNIGIGYSQDSVPVGGTKLAVNGMGYFASTVNATQLQSTVATGTAPLTVNSTTVVSNLNADLLRGYSPAVFHRHLGGMLSNQDFNTIGIGISENPGSSSNNSPAGAYGTLNTISTSIYYGWQMFMESDGSLYNRSKQVSGWQPWRKIYDSGNLTNNLSTNYIPKWNGSSMVNSLISDDGEYSYLSGNRFSRLVGGNIRALYTGGNGLYITNNANTVDLLNLSETGILKILSTTPSTLPTNGALVVGGGVGVGENLNLGGNITLPLNQDTYFGTRSGNGVGLYYSSDNDFKIYNGTGGSNLFTLSRTTGNATIGYSTDQGYKLAVNGTGYFNGNVTLNGDVHCGNIYATSSNSNFISSDVNIGYGSYQGYKLAVNGSGYFNGNVTASNFILSSDRTLKTNIQSIIKDYSRLNLVSFNFKNNLDELRFGTIAQDLLSNGYSEFVTGDKEGEYKVKYIDLIIAKLASAELRIKELEDKYGSR